MIHNPSQELLTDWSVETRVWWGCPTTYIGLTAGRPVVKLASHAMGKPYVFYETYLIERDFIRQCVRRVTGSLVYDIGVDTFVFAGGLMQGASIPGVP